MPERPETAPLRFNIATQTDDVDESGHCGYIGAEPVHNEIEINRGG